MYRIVYSPFNIMVATKRIHNRKNRSVKKRTGGWEFNIFNKKVAPISDDTNDDNDKCMRLKDYLEMLAEEKENFTYPYVQLPGGQNNNGKYMLSIYNVTSISIENIKENYFNSYTKYTLTGMYIYSNTIQNVTIIIKSNENRINLSVRVYKNKPDDVQHETTNYCDVSGGRTKRRRMRAKRTRKKSR